MKLYVWEGVLTDYTDGIMFALANNEDEARKLILDTRDWDCRVETDLEATPDVYDSPVGFSLAGGG